MTIQNQNIGKLSKIIKWPSVEIAKIPNNETQAVAENSNNTVSSASEIPEFYLQRDYCNLIVMIVAEAFSVSIKMIKSKTRAVAEAALARQVAVYLAHTTLSVTYRAAAIYFNRDRTTISHACRVIEDLRDDHQFDQKLSQIESQVLETASQLYGYGSSDLGRRYSQ